MRVRKLTSKNDYSFGHGVNDFWRNVPEAPAQCVMTRLNLHVGDWWLDLTQGTPWETKVLGKYTGSTRDVVLRARALQTQGVSTLTYYNSDFNPDTRAYRVEMTVSTIYGAATVAGPV